MSNPVEYLILIFTPFLAQKHIGQGFLHFKKINLTDFLHKTFIFNLSYWNSDDVTITYGDTDGCVNIIMFSSLGESLR